MAYQICPLHSFARQLSDTGFCMDCGDYPMGKVNSEGKYKPSAAFKVAYGRFISASNWRRWLA